MEQSGRSEGYRWLSRSLKRQENEFSSGVFRRENLPLDFSTMRQILDLENCKTINWYLNATFVVEWYVTAELKAARTQTVLTWYPGTWWSRIRQFSHCTRPGSSSSKWKQWIKPIVHKLQHQRSLWVFLLLLFYFVLLKKRKLFVLTEFGAHLLPVVLAFHMGSGLHPSCSTTSPAPY